MGQLARGGCGGQTGAFQQGGTEGLSKNKTEADTWRAAPEAVNETRVGVERPARHGKRSLPLLSLDAG